MSAKSPVTIYIDDQPYQVDSSDNLLAAVLSQQLNLPYFCWHPAMGSVGACRQCAVTQYQDENDTRGRLVMACTTPVTEGMRIGLAEKNAQVFREQVISAMMTNHPHDCPVCAEGGECHLQDMTVMTGHSRRDYSGSKRTYKNQYLGEFVGHEMNRCITCYRCVRYYKDYAGGEDLGVFGSKNQVYFGRQTDGQLESEFSGNLVEVCPTGVFTNKLFSAHYTRKWDLQSAPSICANCSIGCNTSIGERYGSVRRVVNRYNPDINSYFLCDRGRFGIGFVNSDKRIRQTKGIEQTSPAKLTNLDVAKSLIHYRGKKFAAIGSARASIEANSYLQHIVGKDNFSIGLNQAQMALAAQHKLLLSQHEFAGLAEIEQSDFIFIAGEDIQQTSPRMALSTRQALRNKSFDKANLIGIPNWQDSAVRTIGGNDNSPLFMLQTSSTKLDKVSKQNLILSNRQIIEALTIINSVLGAMVADKVELSAALTKVSDSLTEQLSVFIKGFIESLLTAKRPLVISGWQQQSANLLAEINKLVSVIKSESFSGLAENYQNCLLAVVPPDANTTGLLAQLNENTLSVEEVINRSEQKALAGLIVLENELSSISEQSIQALKENLELLVVIDHTESKISQLADIVMPASAVTECDGHFVNYQGIIQRFYQVHPVSLPVMENWRWLQLIAKTVFVSDELSDAAQGSFSSYANFVQYLQFVGITGLEQLAINPPDKKATARQTHRTSGRTAQMANISVHEAKTARSPADNVQLEQSFSFSMEGKATNRCSDKPFSWAPGWNSNQSCFSQDKSAAETAKLKFTCNQDLLAKWSLVAESKKLAAGLTFNNKAQWYSQEWQTKQLAEFQVLGLQNTLWLARNQLKQNDWQIGGYTKVEINGETQVAQLGCDDNLADNLAYGCFSDFKVGEADVAIKVLSVTDEEKVAYLNNQQQQLARLKEIQQQQLQRLKDADQYIPIRLVCGGLDDV